MHNIGLGVHIYANDNNGYTPTTFIGTSVVNQSYVWLGWTDTYFGQGLLVNGEYIESGSLYCPAQTYEMYLVNYYTNWPDCGFNNYGSSKICMTSYDQIPAWHASEGWKSSMTLDEYSNPDPNIWRYSNAAQLPYAHDIVAQTSPEIAYVHQGSWNVVFIDGHVSTYTESSESDTVSDLVLNGLAPYWTNAQICRDTIATAE